MIVGGGGEARKTRPEPPGGRFDMSHMSLLLHFLFQLCGGCCGNTLSVALKPVIFWKATAALL